jgi:hypothetical protein
MAMTVVCPKCSRNLNVPADLFGELVKCPVCGQNFKVDHDAEPAPVIPEVRPAEPPPAPPPPVEEMHEPGFDEDPTAWKFAQERRRDLQPHRGTTILVLGILSIVLPLVSIILGPLAWALGSADLNAIKQGRMDPTGEGTTRAGYICGVVGTCFAILHCCGFSCMIPAMFHH